MVELFHFLCCLLLSNKTFIAIFMVIKAEDNISLFKKKLTLVDDSQRGKDYLRSAFMFFSSPLILSLAPATM